MSSADKWMPFYVAAYVRDTMHLTTTEHGAYMLLLMHYWTQGPLSDDDTVLASIAKMTSRDWQRVGGKLRRFFSLCEDGLLHQKRMDAERDRTARLSAIKSEATAGLRRGKKPPGGASLPPAGGAGTRRGKGANGHQNGHQATVKPTVNGSHVMDHMMDQVIVHARDAVHLPSLLRKESKKPPLRSGPASGPERAFRSPRDQVMQEGGVVVQALTGLPGRKAHSFVGHLVKLAGDDCSRVLTALREAEHERPVDAQTWLIAAVQPERLPESERMRRDWDLPSVGDAAK